MHEIQSARTPATTATWIDRGLALVLVVTFVVALVLRVNEPHGEGHGDELNTQPVQFTLLAIAAVAAVALVLARRRHERAAATGAVRFDGVPVADSTPTLSR